MACSVPVLLLSFNRPEKTAQVLEQIKLAAPPRIYAHCDGPRAQVAGEAERVAEVRRIIVEKTAGLPLKTLFRENNFGLKSGVSGAIDWFFSQEEYGIILEDDCMPDPTLFRFCEELLLRYKDDPEVMHIGCSNISEPYLDGRKESYVFSKFPFIWGWASWRRAWNKMDIEVQELDKFEPRLPFGRFWIIASAQRYLRAKFQDTKTGKNKTWDYQWFYSILNNNGLCIVPSINLVQNTGIGEAEATNTTKDNELARRAAQSMHFPMVHPASKDIDLKLEQQFFYDSQKSRFRLWIWSILKAAGLR